MASSIETTSTTTTLKNNGNTYLSVNASDVVALTNPLPVASGGTGSTLGIPSKIQPITASVASSALTITLNPTVLDFRASPITSGTVTTITVSAAISVVIPSTSTMGTVSAKQSRIVVIAINNAGTVELAAVNISGGSVLDETTLINTTAAAAAGNSATAYYSTTARTGVAYRVVGYVESTQTTAGTWATAPSTLQGSGGNALTAMSSLGYGQTWQTVTRATGTTYYNTTSKPIQLVVTFQSSGGGYTPSITVAGVALPIVGAVSNIGSYSQASAIIPSGASYILTASGGGVTLAVELR